MIKQVKKILNNPKINFITGLMVGLVIAATGVYAATVVNSKNVTYNNANSTLSSTNVQDALDELYDNSFFVTPRYSAGGIPTASSSTLWTDIVAIGYDVMVKKEKSQLSVCLALIAGTSSNLLCLKSGVANWSTNKSMLNSTLFEGATCSSSSSGAYCETDWYYCGADSSGLVSCFEGIDGDINNGDTGCSVGTKSVNCW